jgi:hypothetical protein
MRDSGAGAIGFRKTVKLLLGAASKRAAGRRKRQQALLQNRNTNKAADWSWVQFGLAALFTTIPNVIAPFVVSSAVESGQRLGAERQGKIAVDGWFLRGVYGSSPAVPLVISDGTVSGDTVSFTVVAARGSRIVSFTGRVDGDRMAFTRGVQVRSGADPGADGVYGASGATSFVAERVDATQGVSGMWVARDVGHAPWVLTLWADGSTLGGTVRQDASESASNNIEARRKALDSLYASEAKQMARWQGGTTSEIERRLRTEVDINSSRNLVAEGAAPGLVLNSSNTFLY